MDETLLDLDKYFEASKGSSDMIFDEILSKKIGLQSILIKMETYLTSKDNQKRSKAVKFISDLIKRSSPGHLNPAEIDHLAIYLSSKLDDHYTVSTAALPGLNCLLHLAELTPQRALDIIRTSVREIHVQSMIQADRNLVFSMCRFGLSSPQIVAEMHTQKYDTDFVFGFIQAMDGEKDPRNLLTCFECVRLVGEQLDLGPFVDEMFEVFACYFPIDFTPPKDDNFTITKQDLIGALRRCFASSAKFAKSTVQLLLDKLNSNVDDAHLDSLEVYTECSRVYDPNDYKEYMEPIWALFHRLAMNTTKSSIEEAALRAIHAMAVSLSRCLQTGGPVSIEWFVAKSVDSCLGYLNEPDLKLVWPNVRCLQSVASASSTANLLVLKKVVPAIIEHYQNAFQQSQKKTYLEILWQFVSSSLQFDKKPTAVLKENLPKLLEICIESEPIKNLRQQSLNGFYTLLSFDNLISDFEPIVKCLWHSIWVNSSASDEEKKKVIEIVHVLSKKDDKLNQELMRSLSESTSVESSTYQNSYKIIEHLAQLNQTDDQTTFNKKIIDIFQSHINALPSCTNLKVDYLISLFESLNSVIAKSNDPDNQLFDLVEKLIDSCLLGDKNSSYSNDKVIIKLSLLVKSFSLKLKKSEISLGFLERVENAFTNDNLVKQFDEIDEQKIKLNILMQVVSSLDKLEFSSQVERIFGKFEKLLMRLAVEDNNEDVNLLGCRFLASFVNKLANVDEYAENARKALETNIEQNKSLKCLNLWIWITKALVLREHKLFEIFTKKIIEWLDYAKLSKMSSSAFGTILNDNPNENLVMTSKTSSNIRLFYKQRFFNFVIEPLKLNFASQEQIKKEQRMFYATSVLSMISPLPKEVLQKHLKSMLPILLYSLSDTKELDENLCLSSLRSFDLVVRESSSGSADQEFLITYTQEILSKLFSMCTYERNMEIRLLALTCVNNLATSLPPDRLIKHQKWVCRELDRSLYDHKRLCRQMAVQARNRWFLLSTKNNEH